MAALAARKEVRRTRLVPSAASSRPARTGYVHLIAIHDDSRGNGLGGHLCTHVAKVAWRATRE